MMYRHDDSALTVMDWFCGAGGSSQGAHAVPGVRVERAANHWKRAIESHAANFPTTDHYQGDIRKAPVWDWPVTDIFWASPECTNWSVAKGRKRSFDNAMQGDLLSLLAAQDDEDEPTAEEESRALMEEVPLYLRGVIERGGLVKAGVVENVTDVRAWTDWDRWLGEIHKLGYRTRVIALNSMHANPRTVHAAPQSRDRLYVGYWHESLGRTPDWDKWLRPQAVCDKCGPVQAVQSWKRPGIDMGRYRQQYVYRCPNTVCRNAIVEPEALPAMAAIDWSIPGQRIGDRTKPLAAKTLARIEAGIAKFARPVPMMVPAGGTWRNDATSIFDPMPARTTRENDALAVPPLMVPVEGRDGKAAASAHRPLRAQTARNETGLAWLPFIAELRGGGSVARPVTESLATVTASGNHHGLVTPDVPAFVMRNNSVRSGDAGYLCTPVSEPVRALTAAGHQSLITWEHLLVPYYGNGTARRVTEPMGALTTRDRYALVHGTPAIEDVLFRMLEPHEIGRAMSFADSYTVLGSKRERVRQYGNAVTPNAAEILLCALVEAITGDEISRHEATPEFEEAA
ncbi:DNA cytosine methyltransferase [Streptomyces noursei]|uniref:DNA cytosine methyltransferase n=1 Tax=Streptomyces noursei TaxID=1971 RepID=UPI001672117D|nr:DNA cytosine methyltransferase [Streptomyces noursei]MCZ1014021.1 DNA cytosine methyltransferase [Streptomyces noursei]GGX49239.1 DNA cytosine methyltransferase [Streptomyces noursei]